MKEYTNIEIRAIIDDKESLETDYQRIVDAYDELESTAVKWTRTDKALPELDKPYLVRDKDLEPQHQFYVAILTSKGWVSIWSKVLLSEAQNDSVTHWMLFPIPDKIDGE